MSKINVYYKLTDQNYKTGKNHNPMKWGGGIIHAYVSPEIAVFCNPAHGNIKNPVLWECTGPDVLFNDGLKIGVRELTTIRQIPLPEITIEQRIKIAIKTTKMFCSNNTKWSEWADKWLSGKDRTSAMAAAITEADARAAIRASIAWAAAAAITKADARAAITAAIRAAQATVAITAAIRAAETAAAQATAATTAAETAASIAWAAEAAAVATTAAQAAASIAWAAEAAAVAASFSVGFDMLIHEVCDNEK